MDRDVSEGGHFVLIDAGANPEGAGPDHELAAIDLSRPQPGKGIGQSSGSPSSSSSGTTDWYHASQEEKPSGGGSET